MRVTQLEADLLLEIAPRGATVPRLLAATRLHIDVPPGTPAAPVLQAVLDGWAARGWLAIAEAEADGRIARWRDVAPGTLDVAAPRDDTRVWLTARAHQDCRGLPLPSHVALQLTWARR